MRTSFLLLFLAVLSFASPAVAQDTGFELRAGPMIHGLEADPRILRPFQTGRIEDVSVELIYTPPSNDVLYWLGSPRLAMGTTVNVRGYENMFHLNANWHVPVFTLPVYLEAGLGGAVVTGYLHDAPPGYRNLGCNGMFYFQAGIGADFGDNWTATLSVEHSSHAWLCSQDNDGLNSLGVKVGYKF